MAGTPKKKVEWMTGFSVSELVYSRSKKTIFNSFKTLRLKIKKSSDNRETHPGNQVLIFGYQLRPIFPISGDFGI